MVMVVVMAGGGRPQLVKSLLTGTLRLEESENTSRFENVFLPSFRFDNFNIIRFSKALTETFELPGVVP